jgi:hypothetical protein
MEENKKKSTLTARLGIMALLLAMIFLIVYMLTVIVGSSSFFAESAEKNALLCFEEDIERAEALAQEHFDNLYGIADKVKNLDSREAVEAVMESYIGSEMFGDLRYYSGGSSYAANGALVVEETSAKEYISALSASNTEGCSPIYYDKHTELDCIAFFVPVRGSEHIDGILSVLPARNLVDVGEVINEKSSAVAIISKDGKVISETVAENFDKNIGNNFYTFINALTNNKCDSALISEAVLKGENAARSIIAQ